MSADGGGAGIGPAAELRILVDADACPVKDEIVRVAERHRASVKFVSNSGLRPRRHPLVSVVLVGQGADAADDWIAERAKAGDVVVTADIPLAARCLERGADVLGPTGRAFTEEGIGMALGLRDLHAHLRETDQLRGDGCGFTRQDRSAFLSALENALRKARGAADA